MDEKNDIIINEQNTESAPDVKKESLKKDHERKNLFDAADLKKAVIMSEILGKPRAKRGFSR